MNITPDCSQTGRVMHEDAGLTLTLKNGLTLKAASATEAFPSPLVLRRLCGVNLDVSWGLRGLVILGLGTCEDEVAAVAEGSDGGLVVLSTAYDQGGTSAVVLSRLHPDGSPDYRFGQEGHVKWKSAARYSVASSMKLERNGQILVEVEANEAWPRGAQVVVDRSGFVLEVRHAKLRTRGSAGVRHVVRT